MAKSREKTAADSLPGREFEVIQVLSDINRIRILRLLSEKGELCAQDILAHFPITQPTLSHHMNVLLDNRLVEARKSGRRVFYSVSRKGLEDIIGFFASLLEAAPAISAIPAEKLQVMPAEKIEVLPKPEKNKKKDKDLLKEKEKSGKKEKKKKKKKKL